MFDLRIGGGSEFVHVRLPEETTVNSWLRGNVEIAVEAFGGNVIADFDAADFLRFEKELRVLYSTLSGSATLCPMEGQVVVTLDGNGRGGITVKGEAHAQATWGNKLEFQFEIDQTFLPDTITQLEAINQGIRRVGV